MEYHFLADWESENLKRTKKLPKKRNGKRQLDNATVFDKAMKACYNFTMLTAKVENGLRTTGETAI